MTKRGTMHQLLSGNMWPITQSIGFIRCEKDAAVDAWLAWQTPIQSSRGVQITRRDISGSLTDVLTELLPLTSVERRRFVFIPTASDWTAFFDNGSRGPDLFPPMSYLAEQIGCEAVGATDIPDGEMFPARILELWGSERGDFLNSIRSVCAAKDGASWTFSATGQVQDFEQVERYAERRISRRFTSEMLDAYLSSLGIMAGMEDFYAPEGMHSTLIEKVGLIASGAAEFGLRRETGDR